MADLQSILTDPNYVSANPETKAAIFDKHAPTDPNFANANPETQAAIRQKFGVTPGGAATSNPNMMAQSRNLRPNVELGGGTTIAGAGVLGGIAGYAAPEILTGLGGAARAFPATAPMAPALLGMANIVRGGRGASAAMGAVGGAVGEAAGQAVESMGGGPVAAEGARIGGGVVGGELLPAAKFIVNKILTAPALSVESKVWKEMAKAIRDKLDGSPQTLTAQERKFLDERLAELRGPDGKTDAPLERVGSIMGDEGQRLLDQSDRQLIAAIQQGETVGKPGAFGGQQNADIGGRLRDVITTRNEAALAARAKQFKETEAARDLNIANREKAGYFIDRAPEYQELVTYLKSEIAGPKNSPAIKAGYQKILDEIYNPNSTGSTSFNAVDQTRRQLGDVFRGKPAQGYEGIDSNVARDVYGRISELQKKYAGPAQEKLLDDYHANTEGLQIFSSKMGKKATALDQYRPEQYATDPSTLPGAYFKTRASVQALRDLTGSNKTVAVAALEHMDKELAGKSGPQVREWMTKNREWLGEVRTVQVLAEKYATRLEAAERSMSNAQTFAKQAAADASLLTRQSLPAQRAVDLIKSGDTKLWGMVTPAIVQSPQAKTQMVQAVKQVIADQATSKNTIDLYSRNIRPFLERANIASKQELDFISGQLDKIQKMDIPDPEKLGMAKRILLQSTGTWAASALSRGGVASYNYMANQVPTEQPFLERRQ